VEKGKVTADDAAALVGRIVPVGGIADLADADLVVEAVTEHLDTKLALFAQLDAAVKPGAVLASNTSSISLTRIAAATRRPADVVGPALLQPRAR
jgi:3-hydroxybutyryl-CoA dehydrogenase